MGVCVITLAVIAMTPCGALKSVPPPPNHQLGWVFSSSYSNMFFSFSFFFSFLFCSVLLCFSFFPLSFFLLFFCSAQLFFSHFPLSAVAAVCGMVSGLAYRSSALPQLANYSLPEAVTRFCTRFLLPLLKSPPPSSRRSARRTAATHQGQPFARARHHLTVTNKQTLHY